MNRVKHRFQFSLRVFILLTSSAYANDDVQKLTNKPSNWAIWGGNYAGTRYSQLNEINARNVNKLKLAWTFSTGILGGHEGGPLVVNDVIYIHTPFQISFTP